MNKKIIGITGAGGHVGRELLRYENTVSLQCDVTNPFEVDIAIQKVKPDVVVHLASKSDVEFCENPQNELKVRDVNVVGTYNVGEMCNKYNCGMVFVSSFQVFSGKKFLFPYTENDLPNPVNFYGLSKVAAEAFHVMYPFMKTIRTSYLFDYHRLKIKLDDLNKAPIEYPTFIKRSFMHTRHFAESLYKFAQDFEKMPPLLHISGSEILSWYEFMLDVAGSFHTKNMPLQRKKELLGFAPRPHKAGLDNSLSYRLGFDEFSYDDGIELMMKDAGML
jgi:dTDP-4-dehydrorhamnose reductase